jgi:hypothetical protein
MALRVLVLTVLVTLVTWLGACAGTPRTASRSLPLPEVPTERARVLDDLGRRAFVALARRLPHALMLDDLGLRALLGPDAANQAAALRASTALGMRVPAETAVALAHARYQGVCLQGARLLPAGPPIGLRSDGFVFDRALVVATEPDGGRVAAWVEGTFVLTDLGFYAVTLQRLETPRRDHADLDLAPCDLEIGVRSPRPVVVAGAGSY